MLRSAIRGLIGLIAGTGVALAQPSPSPPETSAPPSVSAPTTPSNVFETMEEAQPGDHWTYETRDDITGEVKGTSTNVVTEVAATTISVRVGILGNPGTGYITFDHSWNVTNNGIWKYSPNDGTGIRSPLAVGKKWTFQSADVNSTQGVSFRRSGTSKIAAQESITTRAGTFDTFKIETLYSARNVNDPTKKYDVTLLTWYAPAINHWVKRTLSSRSEGHLRDNSSTELVEYGRK